MASVLWRIITARVMGGWMGGVWVVEWLSGGGAGVREEQAGDQLAELAPRTMASPRPRWGCGCRCG